MPKSKIKIGSQYGKLTVSSRKTINSGGIVWKCVCDCGNKTQTTSYNLTSGRDTVTQDNRQGKPI